MAKDRIPYADALEAAQALELSLSFVCSRTLIAGSLRRQKETIGDLELVVIPETIPFTDMFGTETGRISLLDQALDDMGLRGAKSGNKFKQFTWEGMPVDLFITTPECWGVIATIRTGSAEFSHWLVTAQRQGGGCPSHLRVSEGRLWDGGRALETPTEELFFAALEQPWIKPKDRTEGRWRR
jgi:DNA polymerase/3'-5' exonuclease PolX